VTDDLSVYGLGALPDAPDERDYPLSALYAAEGLVASVVLPASYASPAMPPVLDQGSSPMCVAFSSSAMKAWQDRRDQERFFDFDEPRFFSEIGGTAQGAYVRSALERMRTAGYPVVGVGDRAHHRIAAYYAVPRVVATIKAAILDLGPIVVSTTWYRSWFHPGKGVLPAADVAVGGHAIVAYGWDARGLRLRNSWGSGWGISGDCWMPQDLVPHLARRVEGRRRDRAPDPVRAHGRRPGAAEPQRPQGADHRGRQGSPRSPARPITAGSSRSSSIGAPASSSTATPASRSRSGSINRSQVGGDKSQVSGAEDDGRGTWGRGPPAVAAVRRGTRRCPRARRSRNRGHHREEVVGARRGRRIGAWSEGELPRHRSAAPTGRRSRDTGVCRCDIARPRPCPSVRLRARKPANGCSGRGERI
jgi:hypothetical protein